MKGSFVLALTAALAAYAAPQGVTSDIAPSHTAPASCQPTYDGSFQMSVVNLTQTPIRRDLEKRACGGDGSLTINLSGGVLLDQDGRTGYVASNYQFQFDKPAQAGAIFTSGFTICSNGSIALGNNAIWWQCYTGGFYNLYDRWWADQCYPILLEAVPCYQPPASTITVTATPTYSSTLSALSTVSEAQVTRSASGGPTKSSSSSSESAAASSTTTSSSTTTASSTKTTSSTTTSSSSSSASTATKTSTKTSTSTESATKSSTKSASASETSSSETGSSSETTAAASSTTATTTASAAPSAGAATRIAFGNEFFALAAGIAAAAVL